MGGRVGVTCWALGRWLAALFAWKRHLSGHGEIGNEREDELVEEREEIVELVELRGIEEVEEGVEIVEEVYGPS